MGERRHSPRRIPAEYRPLGALLMGALGGNATADHLADLDALVGRLMAAFTPQQAKLWLDGQNPHLGGSPIDVFILRGAGPVIEAVRAHEQGAFA